MNHKTNEIIIEETIDEFFIENPTLTEIEETNMENQTEYLTDNEDIASRVDNLESEQTVLPREWSAVVLTKEIGNATKPELDNDGDVLDGLSDYVHLVLCELNARVQIEVSRSVF